MTKRIVTGQPTIIPANAGSFIDRSDYAGETIDAAYWQPFWDEELFDDQDNPLGYDGDMFSPDPWDCVTLGGHQLPGIWTAQAQPALQLDIQIPRGFDGAALITRGYRPPWITLTGIIGTPWQWALMQKIKNAIWTRPFKIAAQQVVLGKKGKVGQEQTDQGQIVGVQRALSVVNPALNYLEIDAMVLQSISAPQPTDQPQVRQIVLYGVQYVPEPQVVPSAVKKSKGQISRPKDAISEQIEQKDKRAPKLPGQTPEGVQP